ncbi:DNA pilot protein [robinz microvirus RP_65]|nr:DNA pilot protein [robinz microvirus RP_65]
MKTIFINQMLMEPLTGALITGGAQLLGSGINAWLTGKTNRKQMKFNEKMYYQHRKDSLADWYMMNQYNSPQAQMQRFKDANLNPNLIYGQMSDGAVMRSPEPKSANLEAPQVDLSGVSNAVSQYYDVQAKQAQTNNLQKALETADEQIKLIQAQTAQSLAQGKAISVGTDRAAFDLAIQKSLQPLTLEGAQLSVNRQKADIAKTQVDTAFTTNQDIRAAVSNAKSIEEATARIRTMALQNANTQAEKANIEQRTKNLAQDERIKKFDEEMLARGLRPGDALWQRKLVELVEKIWFNGKTPSKFKGYSKETLDRIKKR